MAGRLNEAANVRQGDDKDDVDRGLTGYAAIWIGVWRRGCRVSPSGLESPLEFFFLESLHNYPQNPDIPSQQFIGFT